MADIHSVSGGYFEVTGSMNELYRIMEGITENEGRLTSNQSFSLDLWQEMLEEWFARHDYAVGRAILEHYHEHALEDDNG